MNKETKQWVKAAKAWVKTQKNSISSCDLAITHAKQNIAINERAIKFEQEEKVIKESQLKAFEKVLVSTVKDSGRRPS
jgi:hypothetical protein